MSTSVVGTGVVEQLVALLDDDALAEALCRKLRDSSRHLSRTPDGSAHPSTDVRVSRGHRPGSPLATTAHPATS